MSSTQHAGSVTEFASPSGSRATVLLVGASASLLEGLAQMLGSAGHESIIGATISESIDAIGDRRPVVAVIERSLATTHLTRLPLARGGAIVVFDTETRGEPLAGPLSRMVLAELTLPLERQRLLALVQQMAERCAATDRISRQTGAHRSL